MPIGKRQVEQMAARAARDFDDFYALREVTEQDTDDLLVLTFDGKGVPMRHEDLRPATRAAAEATPRRLHTRLTKGEKRHRKRMAQVAAIYTVAPYVRTPADVLADLRPVRDAACDRDRPRPRDKRVWASLTKPPPRSSAMASSKRAAATRASSAPGSCCSTATATHSSS